MNSMNIHRPARAIFASVITAWFLLAGLLLFQGPAAEGVAIQSDSKQETEQLRRELERLQTVNRRLLQENQKLRQMLPGFVEPMSALPAITLTGTPGTNSLPEASPKTNSVLALSKTVTNASVVAHATLPSVSPLAKDPPGKVTEENHWLSSTGKRHNATCRYFKYPGGAVCGPTEGVPCRLCGG